MECGFSRTVNGSQLYFLVYVDDIIVATKSQNTTGTVKEHVNKNYELTGTEPVSYFLVVKVIRKIFSS